MNSFTLFIPGLLPPAGEWSEQDVPNVDFLEKLLARASREQLIPFAFSDALCMLFGLGREADSDFPIAAISRLVDDDHSRTGIWMRADPVHLRADQRSLILTDESTFTLDQHDALVLAADIREIFSAYDMLLEVPRTNRWYLNLETLPAIRTTPLHEVIGRDINTFMPAGNDRVRWAKLINEIQMALHGSRINEERARRGERPVNSLWLWGCGELPYLQGCSWSRVFADEEIARGFSILAGVPCEELPESLEDALDRSGEEEDVLAVISFGMRHHQYHDIKGWQDFIVYLEEFWFPDLQDYIRNGEIGEFVLLTEYQQFTLDKSGLYKFWKRPKSISAYASHD